VEDAAAVAMVATASGGVLDPHGPAAAAAADLWWLMLWLGIAAFLVFAGALGAGLLRRRRTETVAPEDEPRLVGRWIVAGGVVLPAVVITVVFGATLAAMRHTPTTAPDGALEVEIVGHQFWYEVRYPEAGVTTANELHLPVGRPIAFRLTSADVIHSFWIPALGGKMDLLPERTNTLVLEADRPGEHVSRCAEFCGLQHALMQVVAVVESEEDFAAWLDERAAAPDAGSAAEGQGVFLAAGCAACHAPPGESAGDATAPALAHLPDRPTLGAGALDNTRENAAAWIRDPQASKPGVDMPATELSDGELDALLRYLGYDR
jgi:cytochrome c oxidase subunit 2